MVLPRPRTLLPPMVHLVSRSARRFVAGVVIVGLLVGVAGTRTASARAPLGALGPTRFVVVSPCRLLDTRPANGARRRSGGRARHRRRVWCSCRGGRGGVDGDGHRHRKRRSCRRVPGRCRASRGVDLELGSVRTDPCQHGLVRLSDDGAVRIWVAAATDLVVDVAGAFVPATTSRAGRYVPIAPRRVVDTRSVGRTAAGRHDHCRVARGGRPGRSRPGGEHHPHRHDRVRLRRRLPGGIGCRDDVGAQRRRHPARREPPERSCRSRRTA